MANDVTEVDIYCNNVKESHTTVSLITYLRRYVHKKFTVSLIIYLRRYIFVHKKLDRLDHCALHSNKKALVTN